MTQATPKNRKWTEAAIAICLQDAVSVEQVHVSLLGYLLAEELYTSGRVEPYDQLRPHIILPRNRLDVDGPGPLFSELDEYEPRIRSALEHGDWFSLRYLPQPVWEWITNNTHMNPDDWEAIPSIVENLLHISIKCEECCCSGTLDQVAELVDFAFGADRALVLKCRNCGTDLAFDVVESELQLSQPLIQSPVNAFIAVALIALFLLTFFLFQHK